jgi:hypothetical protein
MTTSILKRDDESPKSSGLLFKQQEPRGFIVIDCCGISTSYQKTRIKELAFTTSSLECGSFTFKCDDEFRTIKKRERICYKWVKRNIHGIDWDDGELPATELGDVVHFIKKNYTNRYSKFYAKGGEKCKLLSTLFDNTYFVDIDAMGPERSPCPNANSLFNCGIPAHSKQCALKKAYIFGCWILARPYIRTRTGEKDQFQKEFRVINNTLVRGAKVVNNDVKEEEPPKTTNPPRYKRLSVDSASHDAVLASYTTPDH